MQLDILIVGVLFPAIPLMMINFGNRYSLLAGLIRSLHDTVINAQTPADDSARFFQQIASLRQRLNISEQDALVITSYLSREARASKRSK